MYSHIKPILDKGEALVVGIMSGTSLDGIDIAFCRLKGNGKDTKYSVEYFETADYTQEEKADLLKLCSSATGNVADICYMNKYLGVKIGNAILSAAKNGGIDMKDVDFVSSHGQTVFHMPEKGATLQIGELADIAAITGKLTVGDFRPSDMAYGGEGAPFVPFVDYLIFRSEKYSRALINIGGISNFTSLPKSCEIDDIVAFDTGPGNVLIDNIMKIHTDGLKSYDKGGDVALKGEISDRLSAYIAEKDWFSKLPPPKSTGRELYTYDFSKDILNKGTEMGLCFEDIVSTVTDYTSKTIANAIKSFVNFEVEEIFVSGGGIHNRFLISRLSDYLGKSVKGLEEIGISGDAKEALAFAVLGNEFLHGNFNNAKKSTGASKNVVMGKLTLPTL